MPGVFGRETFIVHRFMKVKKGDRRQKAFTCQAKRRKGKRVRPLRLKMRVKCGEKKRSAPVRRTGNRPQYEKR